MNKPEEIKIYQDSDVLDVLSKYNCSTTRGIKVNLERNGFHPPSMTQVRTSCRRLENSGKIENISRGGALLWSLKGD